MMEDKNSCYMILQLADGDDLREYLAKNFNKLRWADKFRIAKDIAQGLSYLHRRDIFNCELDDEKILNYMRQLRDAILEYRIGHLDYAEFTNINGIGKGGFGSVFETQWKGKKVALKRIEMDKFLEEMEVQKLIREFAENGNLREYLENEFLKLQWSDKLHIAEEIALGLGFLHDQGIIHRNLHSKSILVHDRRMLVADFGISNQTEELVKSAIEMPEYVDPQYLMKSSYKLDKKSDIYSLGVVFWEISSGRPPFNSLDKLKKIFKLVNGAREIPAKNTPFNFVELYSKCWAHNPNERPLIRKALENFGLSKLMLESSIATNSICGIAGYVEPQCFINPQYKRNKTSDIYSLGVILWEISSGRPPESDYTAILKIISGERDKPVANTPEKYIELYSDCWNLEPEERPEISEVFDELNKLLSD
ncbi:kinase-like domain-containing protein [Gigaspora rosea]|uniref:Kinase-like domain-containing protein n=1 Tax=Gigaspora rosea TaxID=44941 RepID=A0A397V0P2_9GLOM|nr:kinase-like domain-containing protein [Gigaspora rosea]